MQMSCVYLMHRQSQPMYRVCNLSYPYPMPEAESESG
jgi:hypothetical protein